jgi:hypothetical protein
MKTLAAIIVLLSTTAAGAQPTIATQPSRVVDAMNRPSIQRLCSQYSTLIEREADWAKRYGNDHLAVINLRATARDICNTIRQEPVEPTTSCPAICSTSPAQ